MDSVHCVHGWILLFAAGQPGVPDLSGRDVNYCGCAVEMMIAVGIKFSWILFGFGVTNCVIYMGQGWQHG